MMKKLTFVLLIVVSINAWSERPRPYFTVQTGRADMNINEEFLNNNADSYKEDALSLSGGIGIRFVDYFGLEVGFYNIGALEWFENDRIEFKSRYAAFLLRVPVAEEWYLHAKAGVLDWSADANPHNTSQDENRDGTTRTYTLGIVWVPHQHWEMSANHLYADADGLKVNTTTLGFSFVF